MATLCVNSLGIVISTLSVFLFPHQYIAYPLSFNWERRIKMGTIELQALLTCLGLLSSEIRWR